MNSVMKNNIDVQALPTRNPENIQQKTQLTDYR